MRLEGIRRYFIVIYSSCGHKLISSTTSYEGEGNSLTEEFRDHKPISTGESGSFLIDDLCGDMTCLYETLYKSFWEVSAEKAPHKFCTLCSRETSELRVPVGGSHARYWYESHREGMIF